MTRSPRVSQLPMHWRNRIAYSFYFGESVVHPGGSPKVNSSALLQTRGIQIVYALPLLSCTPPQWKRLVFTVSFTESFFKDMPWCSSINSKPYDAGWRTQLLASASASGGSGSHARPYMPSQYTKLKRQVHNREGSWRTGHPWLTSSTFCTDMVQGPLGVDVPNVGKKVNVSREILNHLESTTFPLFK